MPKSRPVRRWPHTTVERLASFGVVRLPGQPGQLERETSAKVIGHRLWMLVTFLADESTKTGLRSLTGRGGTEEVITAEVAKALDVALASRLALTDPMTRASEERYVMYPCTWHSANPSTSPPPCGT